MQKSIWKLILILGSIILIITVVAKIVHPSLSLSIQLCGSKIKKKNRNVKQNLPENGKLSIILVGNTMCFCTRCPLFFGQNYIVNK